MVWTTDGGRRLERDARSQIAAKQNEGHVGMSRSGKSWAAGTRFLGLDLQVNTTLPYP